MASSTLLQSWKAAQRIVSLIVCQNPADEGLEFVRALDRSAISVISMMPFLLSLVFAAVWIGVFVGKYHLDTQVVVQTAFTVAAFIVTAGESHPCVIFSFCVKANSSLGALLIALLAFLDTQAAA